jgi:hypothetical protein
MSNFLTVQKGNLFFDNTIITNLDMDKTESLFFVDCVNDFINDIAEAGNIIEVKVSDDNFGLVVDIWVDSRYDELVETACFYFDDFFVS